MKAVESLRWMLQIGSGPEDESPHGQAFTTALERLFRLVALSLHVTDRGLMVVGHAEFR